MKLVLAILMSFVILVNMSRVVVSPGSSQEVAAHKPDHSTGRPFHGRPPILLSRSQWGKRPIFRPEPRPIVVSPASVEEKPSITHKDKVRP